MTRKFIVVVSDNKDGDGDRTGATWVTLFEVEPTMPEVAGYKYRPWYTDYVVRSGDVKGVVKNHVDFLKSFNVLKEDIRIDDQRQTVKASEGSDTEAAHPS